jgi:hypothetical protein
VENGESKSIGNHSWNARFHEWLATIIVLISIVRDRTASGCVGRGTDETGRWTTGPRAQRSRCG